MTEPIAFLNGQILPVSQVSVPVYDTGFMLGVTVAEQLRTFRGKLFRLNEHLDRLMRSLQIVGVRPGLTKQELTATAERIVAHNHALLAEGDDLGLSIFVTPGPYPTFGHTLDSGPLIGMHTYLLPFHLWAETYDTGQSVIISETRQVPSNCWPSELKCRSRMHYYLADQAARKAEEGARALLLDQEGKITEASTASLVIYRGSEGFVAPPAGKVLPGISITVLVEISSELHLPFSPRDLEPVDVATADEVVLCSTSPCLLPVTRLDGRPIGDGKPGPIYLRALEAWSSLVGVDIPAQAQRFACRG